MSNFSAYHTHFSREHTRVLQGVSLSIQAGEVVSLLGANGAGKSTFLSALAGELNTQESVYLNDIVLSKLTAAEQARSRSILPQKSSLGFDLEVKEVIAMGAYPFSELSHHEVDSLIQTALQTADITALAARRYLELSGGEQQRVHYARAIVQLLCGFSLSSQPRYLLLDEPTASLDPLHQHRLLKSAAQLTRQYPLGVLVVVHDVNLAAQYSDRIALLVNGTVLACDTPQEVLTSDNMHQVYGIHAHVLPHPQYPPTPLVVFNPEL